MTTEAAVPKPDKTVSYATSSSEPDDRGALYLYGNPDSGKIAILCAGYADDHIVFQPFARALAEKGEAFVGVMCLPGFDDRPKDGVSWETHKPDGYTFDEWTNAVREAVKALRRESTNEKATFTGIFHDWGVAAGTWWTNRTIREYEEERKKDDTSAALFKPSGVVYVDVLFPPNPKSLSDIPTGVPGLTFMETVCSWLYKILLAKSFLLQRYVSRYLAATVFIFGFTILNLLGLGPLYGFDGKSTEPLYRDNPKSLFRMCYMAYPYWTLFASMIFSGGQRPPSPDDYALHPDWISTPILYLYGTKKKTQFHDNTSVRMLEREEAESRSLSKVVAVKDAGHFLYVQKQEECLNAVIQFMEDTAAASSKEKESN